MFELWTALVTPFDHDLNIDWTAFEKLVQKQFNARVHGIVIGGTTGESPTLSEVERTQLLQRAKSIVKNDVKIMAGAGSSSTAESIQMSLGAVKAGADSLLIVTPPYNKPTPKGLLEHFRAISNAVSVPICLYHVPGRTAQRLNAETISEITNELNLKYVKEASGDVALFSQCVTQSKARILSGDDFTYLPSLAVGGVGCISVASNIFPRAMKTMGDEFQAGNLEKSLKIHQALFPFFEMLFCETNPAPAKAALASLNIIQEYLRLPLVKVGDTSQSKIRKALENARSQLLEQGISE